MSENYCVGQSSYFIALLYLMLMIFPYIWQLTTLQGELDRSTRMEKELTSQVGFFSSSGVPFY
mgnify:CR=1 FL=1